MRRYYFTINGKRSKRVQKRTAKRLYEAGKDVYFIPCNCNPENRFFSLGIWENKRLDGQYESFEKLCNGFSFYNCNDAETGKYIAFYAEV